jgi:RHS repeat-associated protein
MLTQAYNPATNRRYSDVADANGNLYQNGVVAYDVENRVSEANGVKYAYSADNLRIWRGNATLDELTVYSMGQKLGAYNLSVNNGALVATCTGYYEYFGGKLLKNATGYVGQDRLGSIGKFFPYGQERTATANGTEKFATYTRDAETGLDYAQNRYHSPGDGRFLSPDPYQPSAGPADPGSWNRYAYVGGDPVNGYDPAGLQTITVPGSSITVTAQSGLTPTFTFSLPTAMSAYGAGAATIAQRTDQRPAYCFENEAYYANPAAMPPECMDPNWVPNAPPETPPEMGLDEALERALECVGSAVAERYGLTSIAAGISILGAPIPKAWLPPYRVIGTPYTSVLSVIGHYIQVTIPRISNTQNLLRLGGRLAGPTGALLMAFDLATISIDAYNCYTNAQ